MAAGIRIDGDRDFARAARRLADRSGEALTKVSRKVSQIVVTRTRPKVPRRTGAARASLRTSAGATGVRVLAGGARAVHYPWLDFGGRVGIRKSVQRPFLKQGRYLFPTLIDVQNEQEQAIMTGELESLARDLGLDVR